MSASVRLATAADVQAVTTLLGEQLEDHHVSTPEPEVRRIVELLLLRPHRGKFVVAEVEERIVGVAAVSFGFPIEHGGRGAWLEELYVEPASRGHGLGERLLRAALDVARADGSVAIDLEVEKGHERAESLYRRAGFERRARTHWARGLVPAGPVPVETPASITGGCLCGAVRYAAAGDPIHVSHCHCSLCRRAAGAPLVTWATYPAGDFRWTSGSPARFHSTPDVARSFCGGCGTALTFAPRESPAWVDVTVASMDQADRMWPRDHIWTESRLPWLVLDDDLPRLPRAHEE